MAVDSYSEIIEMQRQAMRRVENMNRQAQRAVKSENADAVKPPEPTAVYTPREPKHTSLPVNIKRREPEETAMPEMPQLTPETDKAIILSILMLLRQEGADELLLLALLYILA